MKCSTARLDPSKKTIGRNDPGKRPQTVCVWGGGAKGHCTLSDGGDGDDDADADAEVDVQDEREDDV